MAFSFVNYTGDGTNRVFAVPFNYIDRSHVKATVDGVNRAFTWLAPNSIQLATAPANGAAVQVRRYTPSTSPLVNFTDGSTITEQDLDTLAYQSVFLAQEAIDVGEELEADLATAGASILAAAQAAQAAASAAQTDAEEALATAEAVEALVTGVGAQVTTDAAAAAASASAAAASATAASGSAGTATSQAGAASSSASAAAASAAAAAASAASAAAAAGFDPDDFYTKVQIDANRTTWLFEQTQIVGLATALAGKANTTHTHVVADISGLQTILDGKLGVSANAASASQWQTARTLTLGGDATGSVAFNGSANFTLTVTVVDNSHNHTIANVTGLQAALDDKAGFTTSSNGALTDYPVGSIVLAGFSGTALGRNAVAKVDVGATSGTFTLSTRNDPPGDLAGTWRVRGRLNEGTLGNNYYLMQRVS